MNFLMTDSILGKRKANLVLSDFLVDNERNCTIEKVTSPKTNLMPLATSMFANVDNIKNSRMSELFFEVSIILNEMVLMIMQFYSEILHETTVHHRVGRLCQVLTVANSEVLQ